MAARFASPGPTVTSFATMGTSATGITNTSGAPSPYTTNVVKEGSGKSGMLGPATAAHRTGRLERLGAKYHPTATMSYPNAPEASQTQRNTRIVPSASGYRDFWASRAYRQGVI